MRKQNNNIYFNRSEVYLPRIVDQMKNRLAKMSSAIKKSLIQLKLA